MNLRASSIPVWLALLVLLTACPIETKPVSHPVILNTTDHTIWLETIREDPGGLGLATQVDPRERVAVRGHTDPCLSFDTLRILAGNPAETDDPEVLIEHDLRATPICERETWVFDGSTLERAL